MAQSATDTPATDTPVIHGPPAFAPPPQIATDGRLNLVGLSRSALAAEMTGLGEKPFRAKQLWHWIYHRGLRGFEAMTSLAKGLRAKLAERYVIARPAVSRALDSADG